MLSGVLRITPAKTAIMGVNEQLFSGLGILHHDETEIGYLHFERIIKAHGNDLMALRQVRQRRRPSRSTNEIRNHKDQRPSLHHPKSAVQKLTEVGNSRLRTIRPCQNAVENVQHVTPA